MKRLFTIIFLFLFSYAQANESALEQIRYQELLKNIRCPTCQNSNIAESEAPLAKQLRVLVMEQIQQGRSDKEIEDFLISRYGDFISYKPPLRLITLALWLLPLLALIVLSFFALRKRKIAKIHKLNLEINKLEQKKLPLSFYLLSSTIFLCTIFYWFANRGQYYWQWRELQNFLDKPVQQALHLQFLPNLQQMEQALIFCQALQAKIDRNRNEHLQILGECYSIANQHGVAKEVYAYLRKSEPESALYKSKFAQADLFANPDSPIKTETETLLRELIASEQENTLYKVLLAAALEKSQRAAEALPLWQEVYPDLHNNDPLKKYIQEKMKEQNFIISLQICPAKKENLSGNLVFTLKSGDKNLLQRVLPVLAQQNIFIGADELISRDNLRVEISANNEIIFSKNINLNNELSLNLCEE